MGESHPWHVTIGVGITLSILVVVVFALRIYTRVRITRSIGFDDIFIAFAFLVTIPYNVDQMNATKYGLGRHQKTLTKASLHNFYLSAFSLSILYGVGLGLIKASVLAFYIRLGHAYLRTWSKVLLAIVLMQAVANTFACIFQCTPVRAKWDYSIKHAHCININLFFTLQTAFNVLTDILVYALPIPMICKLHVSTRYKMLIAYNLCLGSFACIASVLRLYYVVKVLTEVETDATYLAAWKMGWAMVELNVGFLAVSIPSLRPFVKQVAPSLLGLKSSSGPSDRVIEVPSPKGPTTVGSMVGPFQWSGWSGETRTDRKVGTQIRLSDSSAMSTPPQTSIDVTKSEVGSSTSPVNTPFHSST